MECLNFLRHSSEDLPEEYDRTELGPIGFLKIERDPVNVAGGDRFNWD